MQEENLRENFFKHIATTPSAMGLFEYIPDYYFFVKDIAGRFMAMNHALLDLIGIAQESDILGKTDHEVFPKHLAESYERDDKQVFLMGKTIINRMELSRNSKGEIDWYSTNKIPIFNHQNKIIGLVGFSRDMKKSQKSFKPFMEMSASVDYILANYNQSFSIKKLAELATLSVSQFERRFKQCFQVTVTEYIQTVRFEAACQYLMEGEKSIAWIAFQTGHYDHSHFTRYFTKIIGKSPKQYREHYLQKSELELAYIG